MDQGRGEDYRGWVGTRGGTQPNQMVTSCAQYWQYPRVCVKAPGVPPEEEKRKNTSVCDQGPIRLCQAMNTLLFVPRCPMLKRTPGHFGPVVLRPSGGRQSDTATAKVPYEALKRIALDALVRNMELCSANATIL